MVPKVSFITGVKNRSEELKEMIQSLIDQDMVLWEALIVDDHSEEDIKSVVDSFSDERLLYFVLPEGKTGICNARNLAIENSRAEIMLTADGDDINLPQRASVTYDLMTKNNWDVFYAALNMYIPDQKKRYKHMFQPFNAELFRMINFMTNPSTAFKKNKFLEVGGYDPVFEISEDYDLWLRLLKNGAKFGFIDEVLVDYRRSSANVTVQKYNEIHKFIMKTRIKNNIAPFDIQKVRDLATPEVANDILNETNLKIWQDDRYE